MASFQEDIHQVYALAEREASLANVMEAILSVLERHEDALGDITHRYYLYAKDTGYGLAFGLQNGILERGISKEAAEVTVIGREVDLLQVMSRRVSPLKALMLGKISVKGEKAALLRLAKFLE